MVFDALQVIGLVVSTGQGIWPQELLVLSERVFGILRVLLALFQWKAAAFTAAMIIVWLSIANVGIVAYSFAYNRHQWILPVRTLRWLVAFSMGVGFIPLLEQLLLAVVAPASVAPSASAALITTISVISAVLFVPFVLMGSLLLVEGDPSALGNPMRSPSGLVAFFLTAARSVFVIVSSAAFGTQGGWLANLVYFGVAAGVAVAVVARLPYYQAWPSRLQAALYSGIAWTALGSLFLGILRAGAASSADGDIIARAIAVPWLAVLPLSLVIGWRAVVVHEAVVADAARDFVVAMAIAGTKVVAERRSSLVRFNSRSGIKDTSGSARPTSQPLAVPQGGGDSPPAALTRNVFSSLGDGDDAAVATPKAPFVASGTGSVRHPLVQVSTDPSPPPPRLGPAVPTPLITRQPSSGAASGANESRRKVGGAIRATKVAGRMISRNRMSKRGNSGSAKDAGAPGASSRPFDLVSICADQLDKGGSELRQLTAVSLPWELSTARALARIARSCTRSCGSSGARVVSASASAMASERSMTAASVITDSSQRDLTFSGRGDAGDEADSDDVFSAAKGLRELVADPRARQAIIGVVSSPARVEHAARILLRWPGVSNRARVAASFVAFEAGMACFPTGAGVRINYARFVEAASGDTHRALGLLRAAAASQPSFDERFAIFQRLRAAEQTRQTTSLGKSAHGLGSADYLEYKKLEKQATSSHIKAVRHLKRIWARIATWEKSGLFQPGEAALRPLAKRINNLDRASKRATTAYMQLVGKYPRATPLLRQFGCFLLEVRSRPDGAEALFNRADEVEDEDSTMPASGGEPSAARSVVSGGGSSAMNRVLGGGAGASSEGGSKASASMMESEGSFGGLLERSRSRVRDDDFKAVADLQRGVGGGVLGMAVLMVVGLIVTIVMLQVFQRSIDDTSLSARRAERAQQAVYGVRSVQLAAASGNSSVWEEYRASALVATSTADSANQALRRTEGDSTVSSFMSSKPIRVLDARGTISASAARQTNPADAFQDLLMAVRSVLSLPTAAELEPSTLRTSPAWRFVMDNAQQEILPALASATVLYELNDVKLASLFHGIQISIFTTLLLTNAFIFICVYRPAATRVAARAVSLADVAPAVIALGAAKTLLTMYERADRRLHGEDDALDSDDDDGGASASGPQAHASHHSGSEGAAGIESTASRGAAVALPKLEDAGALPVVAEEASAVAMEDAGSVGRASDRTSSSEGRVPAICADQHDEMVTQKPQAAREGDLTPRAAVGTMIHDAGSSSSSNSDRASFSGSAEAPAPASGGALLKVVHDDDPTAKAAHTAAGPSEKDDDLEDLLSPGFATGGLLGDTLGSKSALDAKAMPGAAAQERKLVHPSLQALATPPSAAQAQAERRARRRQSASSSVAFLPTATLDPAPPVGTDTKAGGKVAHNPGPSPPVIGTPMLQGKSSQATMRSAGDASTVGRRKRNNGICWPGKDAHPTERQVGIVSRVMIIILAAIAGLQSVTFATAYKATEQAGEEAAEILAAAERADATLRASFSLRELLIGDGEAGTSLAIMTRAFDSIDQARVLDRAIRFGSPKLHLKGSSTRFPPQARLLYGSATSGLVQPIRPFNSSSGDTIGEFLTRTREAIRTDLDAFGMAAGLGRHLSTADRMLAYSQSALNITFEAPETLLRLRQRQSEEAILSGTGQTIASRRLVVVPQIAQTTANLDTQFTGLPNATRFAAWSVGPDLGRLLADENLGSLAPTIEGPLSAMLQLSVILFRQESAQTVAEEIVLEVSIMGVNLLVLAVLYWGGLRTAMLALLQEAHLSHGFLDTLPPDLVEGAPGGHLIHTFFVYGDEDEDDVVAGPQGPTAGPQHQLKTKASDASLL